MRHRGHSNNLSGGKPSPACRHIQRRIPLFLDGELSGREAQNVATHLAGCTVCQREREQWRQSENALAGARQHVPSAGDLRAGFYARLAAPTPSRPPLPRIDWRVAVPTLAACGLAFGWLTAKRPVVPTMTNVAPSITDNITAASPAVPHQQAARPQVARSDNSHSSGKAYGLAANKPLAGASSPFRIADSDYAERAANDNRSANNSRSTHRNANPSFTPRAKRQIASLNLRRDGLKRLERENPLRFGRRATPASFAFSKGSAKSAGIVEEALVNAKISRSRNRKQDTAFYADNDSKNRWELSPQTSNAALQKDSNALAKTTNDKRSVHTFGYTTPGAKSNTFGELRERLLSSVPAQNALADANEPQTFALGLNAGMQLSSADKYKGRMEAYSADKYEGIDLQVVDTKRGFTSGTRIASRVQEQNGRRVLTIEAEDTQSPLRDDTQATPGSEPK